MIPFDFQYAYPETIEEAVQAYHNLDEEKLMPIYYGGGTEIISQAKTVPDHQGHHRPEGDP